MSIWRRMELYTSLTLQKTKLQMNQAFPHKTQSTKIVIDKRESTLQDTVIGNDFENRALIAPEIWIAI